MAKRSLQLPASPPSSSSSSMLDLLSAAAERELKDQHIPKASSTTRISIAKSVSSKFIQPFLVVQPNIQQPPHNVNLNDFIGAELVKCKHCSFTSSKELLLRHVQSQHSDLIQSKSSGSASQKRNYYVCGECLIAFQNADLCRQHIKTIHSKNQKQTSTSKKETPKQSLNNSAVEKISREEASSRSRCPFNGCLYRFKKKDLEIHLACHPKDVQKRESFVCSQCQMHFKNWRKCAMHLWNEHKIDIDLLKCHLCDNFKTVSPAKLDNHIQAHEANKVFRCGVCRKTFSQLSHLRNHAVIHLDAGGSDLVSVWHAKKQCDICNKFFSDSKCLKKHVQSVHSKLKPYICHVCNHQSARKAMLKMHMRQHTGEKPYKCDQCSYSTGDHNSLRRHKMGHSGRKQYKCPFCDFSSIHSHSFKKHVLTSHPNRSQDLVYACPNCQFTSVNQETYFTHIKSHENEEESLVTSSSSSSSSRITSNTPTSDTTTRGESYKKSASGAFEKAGRDFSKKGYPNKGSTPKKDVSLNLDEDDSLHATMDFGGTTIPAT